MDAERIAHLMDLSAIYGDPDEDRDERAEQQEAAPVFETEAA